MKGNIIKYIFIIFIIIVIIAVISKVNEKEKHQEEVGEQVISKVEEDIIKEMTFGIAEFDTINPIISQNKHVQEISKIIFEPLLELDEQYKLKKCLAQDWAKTSENTYLVKIKDNIKWSDGSQFVVEDVIFTINILKQVQSIYSSNVQNIVSVEKINEDTLKIVINQEIPFFEYNLIFPIISSHYYEGQDLYNTEKNLNPICTGKYKVVENIGNSIILGKNENYKREEMTLEKITVIKYTTLGEMYNAFKQGKIDLMTTTNTGIENHIGTIGYNKQEVLGREFEFFALNTTNTILSYTEVRDAISHAINKENIVSSIYGNKYKVTNYPLDYGNWLSGDVGDNSYNPDMAKQILEQNGWVFQYNKWQKTENYYTKTLKFKIVVQASNQTRVTIAEMIKYDLEAIGMNVTIVKANDNQYNYYLKNKNYDSIIMGITSSLTPNLETYFGYSNFNNQELNNLMAEVKNITNEDMLKEKYQRIRQIFNEQNPFIGLYSSYYCIASSWSFRGNITPNWYNIFIDINNWYKN